MVQLKLALLGIRKVVLQSFFDGAKRNLVPRYFMLGKQTCFLCFVAGVKGVAGELGAVKEMHLAHTCDVHHGEQLLHFKLRTGFFYRFTCRALSHGCVQFHKASWQGPLA